MRATPPHPQRVFMQRRGVPGDHDPVAPAADLANRRTVARARRTAGGKPSGVVPRMISGILVNPLHMVGAQHTRASVTSTRGFVGLNQGDGGAATVTLGL